jgi:hypothetical protein
MLLKHGSDLDDGGMPTMTWNPEQLKEAILSMFSHILKAQEKSL